MSRRAAIATAIAMLACGVSGDSATAATSRAAAGACANAGTVATNDAAKLRAIEAMRCIVNVQRAQFGLRALRASTLLRSAAENHSREMVAGGFLSHTSANGDTVRRRAARTGYVRRSSTLVGETLTWGSGTFATPSELVAALMASPPHRSTLLDRRFRDIGVGMALGAPMAGMTLSSATVTVDFGRR